MCRFEDVTEKEYKMLNDMIGERFSPLAGAKFQILFDTKKKTKGGKIVLGRIQSTNDLTKFLTADDTDGEGADYIIYFDKNVWEKIEDVDKKRIMFHELNHCDVDLDKKNPFKIKDHEITGFYDEFKFNEDDPKWSEKLATIAESIYDDE